MISETTEGTLAAIFLSMLQLAIEDNKKLEEQNEMLSAELQEQGRVLKDTEAKLAVKVDAIMHRNAHIANLDARIDTMAEGIRWRSKMLEDLQDSYESLYDAYCQEAEITDALNENYMLALEYSEELKASNYRLRSRLTESYMARAECYDAINQLTGALSVANDTIQGQEERNAKGAEMASVEYRGWDTPIVIAEKCEQQAHELESAENALEIYVDLVDILLNVEES